MAYMGYIEYILRNSEKADNFGDCTTQHISAPESTVTPGRLVVIDVCSALLVGAFAFDLVEDYHCAGAGGGV